MEGAPTELWRFACEGFLGNLTREHQAGLARVEAELEATVDGQTIPYRMLRVAMSNEPDRDKRRALEETRVRLLDENLNPVYLDAAQIDREAVQQLGVPNYYELYTRFGFKLDSLADECRELLDETEKLWEREGDRALPLAARDRALGGARLGRRPALPRTRARPALPVGSHGARARGDADRPRGRPPLAEQRPPRSRDAAVEDAARVLRADRGAREGDARHPADRRQGRLGGALPRGRPHRALRAHERRPDDGGEAPRRHGGDRRLGDADAAPRHRAGMAQPPARRAPAGRPRLRRRRLAPLLRTPLLREAPVRARVLPGRRPAVDARPLRTRSSATR